MAKKDNYVGKIFYDYFFTCKKVGIIYARRILGQSVTEGCFSGVFANRKVSSPIYKYIVVRGEDDVKVEDTFNIKDESFFNFAILVNIRTNGIVTAFVSGDYEAPKLILTQGDRSSLVIADDYEEENEEEHQEVTGGNTYN